MTGFSSVSDGVVERVPRFMWVNASTNVLIARASLRSAPAEKYSGPPVMMTPRTDASVSALRNASAISSVILMLMALRRSGRCIVMMNAAPSCSVRMVSNAMCSSSL